MYYFQKTLKNVLMLTICVSLPCQAQERSSEPENVVFKALDATPVSLDMSSLPDDFRDPNATIRNFEFGGEFRIPIWVLLGPWGPKALSAVNT